LPVHCRTIGRALPFAGVGRVVNISSGGILVCCPHELRTGDRTELNIEWPTLLDGRVPLRLFAVGRVVRCEASCFAVEFARHEFRTTGKRVIPIDAANLRREQ
jgi:hypothetical protein